MNTSRLVEIRLNDAIENIQRIEETLDKAIERRKSAQDLDNSLRMLMQPARVLSRLAALVQQSDFVRRFPNETSGLTKELVDQADSALKELKEGLETIQIDAQVLGEYHFNRQQLEQHKKRTKKILKQRRNQLTWLQRGPQATRFTPAELLGQVEKEKPFWGEYIETIAGVVLRDEGFDAGLSVLSDAVMQLCTGEAPGLVQVLDPLNILGRDETVLKDLQHTVYFRFPGWSVWTLPLIAHDVWHASDQGGADFKEELKKIPQALAVLDIPFVQDCLADTYATYVMGPAYASACISLLLDVHASRDRVRAAIIFMTLRFLSRCEPNEKCPLSDDLEKEWGAACELQRPKPAGGESCLLGQRCELVDQLLSAYFANRSASTIACRHASAAAPCPMRDAAPIEPMCSALMSFLDTAPLKEQPCYSDDAWVSKSKELEGFIRRSRAQPASRPELDGLFKDSGLDHRHVLRAGWYARWKYPDDESEATQAMAANIRDLCQALLKSAPSHARVSKDNNGSGV